MTSSLVERSVALRSDIKRIQARKAAVADQAALQLARDEFEAQLNVLQSANRQAELLEARGVKLKSAGVAKTATRLRDFADQIETDPLAVRDRTEIGREVSRLVGDRQAAVQEALEAYIATARAGVEDGLPNALAALGLKSAAKKIAEAMADANALDLGSEVLEQDLAQFDRAATSLAAQVAALQDPKHAAMIDFLRRVAAGKETLADLDPELLAQLKAASAAQNFAIRLKTS